MTLFLSLVLLVDGHHPLPTHLAPTACGVSEQPLRQVLETGHRRQRLRAMAILRRCNLVLPIERLRNDTDPEVRLSAWRITLSAKAQNNPLWNHALQILPPSQARSILRWRDHPKRLLEVPAEQP